MEERKSIYKEVTSRWKYDPDLVSANEMRSPPAEYVDEGDIEKVWRTLMGHLCPRHRTNKRNGRETDYEIEELRTDHYGAFIDSGYFRRIIAWLVKKHPEVEVDGNIIRLTRFGLDNCEKYDRSFQRDFEY
jgi:hypothetical protein